MSENQRNEGKMFTTVILNEVFFLINYILLWTCPTSVVAVHTYEKNVVSHINQRSNDKQEHKTETKKEEYTTDFLKNFEFKIVYKNRWPTRDMFFY